MRIIERFEQAASPNLTDTERRALLHFAIVGGGPTGIEFAAELHGERRQTRPYRRIRRAHTYLLLQTCYLLICLGTIQEYTNYHQYPSMKVSQSHLLLELMQCQPFSSYLSVSQHILGGFDEGLQEYASKRFQREGITLKKGHHVEKVEAVS